MINFVNLQAQRCAYRQELESAEKEILDSGAYIGGSEVAKLEEELSLRTTGSHVITCGSGTDALTLALLALDVQPGDEVVVPDFTFIAPAECVARLGATPVFADIHPATLQISPESVQKLIGSKTKGIVAVNLFGQCAPYAELRKIADEHGLWILEDSAQAFGATQSDAQVFRSTQGDARIFSDNQGGRPACTFGDISITSFYPTKPLGCYGDGGAVFTKNKELAHKVRMLANHGSEARYQHEIIGLNSRLDALQAAVLRVKLRHFDEEIKRRAEIAAQYNAFFAGIEGISPQEIAAGNTSTYAQYTVMVENRAEFLYKLDKAGIPHCIHYPAPLHRQPCFAGLPKGPCGAAEAASESVVSLPMCAFTPIQDILERLSK